MHKRRDRIRCRLAKGAVKSFASLVRNEWKMPLALCQPNAAQNTGGCPTEALPTVSHLFGKILRSSQVSHDAELMTRDMDSDAMYIHKHLSSFLLESFSADLIMTIGTKGPLRHSCLEHETLVLAEWQMRRIRTTRQLTQCP